MTVLSALLRPMAWFRRPAQTDYEEVLAGLTADIDSVQTNLVQIQARKRRATLILPFWASVLWLVWTALAWWLGQLGTGGERGGGTRDNVMLVWGPIIGAPILIFFTRRIVRWWYKRVQALEEEHLKELQRQRRAKIEEIKRATRYDHLRMLLDKYDNEKAPGGAGPPGAPKPGQQGPPQTPKRGGAPGSANASPAAPPAGAMIRGGQPGAPRPGAGPAHIQPIQPLPSGMRGQQAPQPAAGPGPGPGPVPAFARPPLPMGGAAPPAAPLQRTWLDRMADAVLGADPSSAALGPEQKYALICAQCKRHNGLAARDEFDEVQYICPHCGTFNTRRPSSVPVSSPWATPSRAQAQPPASPAAGAGRLHPNAHAHAHAASQRQGKKLFAGHADDDGDGDGEDDVGNDSAPPASPLGATGSSDDDDEGAAGEYLISSASSKGDDRKARASGLSRRSGHAAGSEDIDVDVDADEDL